jgi:hypothetical protein
MGILDKLDKAKKATGTYSGGNKGNFPKKTGLWVNLDPGENRVRLGGNVVVCERHYVVDLVAPEALKSQGDQKPPLSKNITCLNWDINNQQPIDTELHCCAVCDLRTAANILRDEAKKAEKKEDEENMKKLSGKAYARSRYSWDAIDRENPEIKTTQPNGDEVEAKGWKILNLGKEGTEAIEELAKQYPQIADEDEGCDIVVSKHKSNRITYGASFDLDGPNIALSPLTDEEKEMEKIDLLRYVASHVSPRLVFQNLKPEYQEIITETLGKTEEDYPEEAPVKKIINGNDDENKNDESPKRSSNKASAPVRRKATNVADEFEELDDKKESSSAKNDTFEDEGSSQEDKPSPPKAPSKPKPPSRPKPPKKDEENQKEDDVQEKESKDDDSAEDESNNDDSDSAESIEPQCFGYYDESVEECQGCDLASDCEKKTTSDE